MNKLIAALLLQGSPGDLPAELASLNGLATNSDQGGPIPSRVHLIKAIQIVFERTVARAACEQCGNEN